MPKVLQCVCWNGPVIVFWSLVALVTLGGHRDFMVEMNKAIVWCDDSTSPALQYGRQLAAAVVMPMHLVYEFWPYTYNASVPYVPTTQTAKQAYGDCEFTASNVPLNATYVSKRLQEAAEFDLSIHLAAAGTQLVAWTVVCQAERFTVLDLFGSFILMAFSIGLHYIMFAVAYALWLVYVSYRLVHFLIWEVRTFRQVINDDWFSESYAFSVLDPRIPPDEREKMKAMAGEAWLPGMVNAERLAQLNREWLAKYFAQQTTQ